jgi:hypothetical protein
VLSVDRDGICVCNILLYTRVLVYYWSMMIILIRCHYKYLYILYLLYMTYKYSRTSLARTRMARIPWIAHKPIVIAYLLYKQHEV